MMNVHVLCVLAFCYVGVSSTCVYPPSVWCSSPEIAESCQVSNQCRGRLPHRVSTEMGAPKVNFSLYYESMCGSCEGFFIEQLRPTHNVIPEIMNIFLIPYGNARETKHGKTWVFQCQHGEEECRGNMLETCSLYVLNGTGDAFPLIACVELLNELSPENAFIKCYKQMRIDPTEIYKCANSTLGNHLEHLMALKTAALSPPHQYVPWVTLNGKHTDEIQNEAMTNLFKLICDTYTGPKPSVCTKVHEPTNVCRKD